MPAPRRKRPSAALRATIAFEQDYRCKTCGKKLPIAWEIDHIVPLCDPSWSSNYVSEKAATAAANARSNLQALCCDCHGTKSLYESSEPELAPPPPARTSTTRIPWEAARLKRRLQTEAIWNLSSPRDRLNAILTSEEVWPQLSGAQTEAQLRRVHRLVQRRGRLIDFPTFKLRVDHLLSS